jgi:hypothetical protein
VLLKNLRWQVAQKTSKVIVAAKVKAKAEVELSLNLNLDLLGCPVARRLRAFFDGAQDNRHMSLFQQPAVLAAKL